MKIKRIDLEPKKEKKIKLEINHAYLALEKNSDEKTMIFIGDDEFIRIDNDGNIEAGGIDSIYEYFKIIKDITKEICIGIEEV